MGEDAIVDARLYHTVSGTPCLNDLSVADVDSDVPRLPHGQTRNLRDGTEFSFLCCGLVHLVGGNVRHSVRPIQNLVAFIIEPAVAFYQTHAVNGPASQPVGNDEVIVAAHSIRVLFHLGFQQAAGQDLSIGSPYIAPMLIASPRGPHDQVFVILIAWVGEFRHVDIVRPNPFHDFCEVLPNLVLILKKAQTNL